MKMDKFFRPSKRSRIKSTYQRYCPVLFKMNPHCLPCKPAKRPRTPLSPRPETPLSLAESFVTDERILHKCRVAPLCDWIYTYHNYAHSGNAREWSLLALKAAVTFITYAVHTMSQDIIDVDAALDENRHEDDDQTAPDVFNHEDEDAYQNLLGEGIENIEDEEQAILIEENLETEEELCEQERKELRFRQIVNLECSVKLLLTSFEKKEAAVMIEDRIRECQRVLIMIVGTDENGVCL